MRTGYMRVFIPLLLAFCSLLAQPAQAQAPFPDRPIKLVVPFAPGGSSDALGRLLAKKMTEKLGSAVVVINVGGAGGTIGSAQVAAAPPDGYSLVLGSSGTHSTAESLYPQLPYKLKSFTPLASVAYLTSYLVLGSSERMKDIRSVNDLVAAAKAAPGAINFASPGNGTPAHLVDADTKKWAEVIRRNKITLN